MEGRDTIERPVAARPLRKTKAARGGENKVTWELPRHPPSSRRVVFCESPCEWMNVCRKTYRARQKAAGGEGCSCFFEKKGWWILEKAKTNKYFLWLTPRGHVHVACRYGFLVEKRILDGGLWMVEKEKTKKHSIWLTPRRTYNEIFSFPKRS